MDLCGKSLRCPMPNYVRLITIKVAGPEGLHCDDECERVWDQQCIATPWDGAQCLYLRTPECLRDARGADEGEHHGK